MSKNLLFIFADQWRRHAVGVANEDEIMTPNMDALAQKGVWCENAVSSFPLCSPHRASLFTGRNMRSHGVFTNCKTGLSMRLGDSERCIAQVLCDNGYRTGYIGKWHLDEPEVNNSPSPASGAKKWDAYTPAGVRRHGFEFWHSYGANDEHLTPHYWENSEKQIKCDKWSPEHETDVAIDFINKGDKNKPFCLYVSWNPPHSPYELVPDKYLKLYENREIKLRENVCLDNIHHHTGEPVGYTHEEFCKVVRQYYAAVSGLDDQLGRIMQELEKQDLLKDTIVVVSADHGDMLGSHGLMAKHVWHEESTGIPFIIGGADIKPGRCGTVFGSADIAPTMLDMLDMPIPAEMQGKSVAKDILKHKTDSESYTIMAACPGRDVFLEEFAAANKNPQDYGWRAIRTLTHTYVINAGYLPINTPTTERLLYDNINDKYQKSPKKLDSASQDEIAKQLEELLIIELKKENDGFIRHI